MKRVFFAIAVVLTGVLVSDAQTLTIIHTNDTHSQIDPTVGPENLGGVARRKVLIDSIRAAAPASLLVDAGDAVQGSMFFTLFGGEVEQKLINALGYDIQILGNHEFDNGLEALAKVYRDAAPTLLATNYDLRETPLAGMFKPYFLKDVEGKRVGFFALNINPTGLIDDDNRAGVRYLETIDAANAMAWYLKNVEHADMVVALTHIGYDENSGTNDRDVAAGTRNIDVIIGGHSHTLIDPASSMVHARNLDGDTVLIAQTGSKGRYLGEVKLDLGARKATSAIHPLGAYLDGKADGSVEAIVAPYRHRVDSISSIKIGKASVDFPQDSDRLLNWLSDFVKARGEEMSGTPVDLSIMNKGGIRNSIAKGAVTKGSIMTMLPFDNRIVVIDIAGSDLIDNLAVMARENGQGVSKGVAVTYNDNGVVSANINGETVDPTKTYRLATISYLANGGDYMSPLKKGRTVAVSNGVIFNDIIDAFEKGALKGKTMKPDDTRRMTRVK